MDCERGCVCQWSEGSREDGGGGERRASLRNVGSPWDNLTTQCKRPFWEDSPSSSTRLGVFHCSLLPSLAPGCAWRPTSEVLFPTRSLLLRGPASSSWRGPDYLSSLSKRPCQTPGTVHLYFTAGVGCTQPSLRPQVLSLLLGPVQWSLQAGLTAPLCR